VGNKTLVKKKRRARVWSEGENNEWFITQRGNKPGEGGVKIKGSQSRVCRLKVLEQRI